MADRTRRKAGDKHGKLTLIRTAKSCGGVGGWICICDCGNETHVRFDSMKSTHSCGCLRRQRGEDRAKHHGHGTKAYQAWSAMKQRCYNVKHPAYHNYGGRGITVCDRWLNDASAFLEDMGFGGPGMELDRIDNAKGYEPSNCRWVDKKANANNRRTNVVIDGLTLAQAADLSGHSVQVLSWRIYKMGMSLKEAMRTPKLRKR